MTIEPNERGAALLTVLLLVAVMATVAATALDRVGLATRLAGNARDAAQAQAWLATAELIAMTRIEDLLESQPKRTLGDNWLGVSRSIDLPDGMRVRATVEDGGNCFNLNALAQLSDKDVLTPRPEGLMEFAALMSAVGIDPTRARKIAAAATDYIDEDGAPGRDGVEAGGYPPHALPANRPMTDPSELRAVPGVSAQDYARLERWLCALPVSGKSPINVNTLRPEEAPLLVMLVQGKVDPVRARAILAQKPAGGYGNVDEFFNAPAFASITIPGAAREQAKVVTEFFTLNASVEGRDAGELLAEQALIDARQVPARLISRQWVEFQ
ncbi:MAG TPA: type II secretion system minor pseudopilin GspK [Sphingomicrobium sp.]|nr:type II secretion system minor pseudopilin GspK [Sphingomicrobium sp.]